MHKRRLSANTLRSAHSTNGTNNSKQIEKLLKQMEDFKVEYEQQNEEQQNNSASQQKKESATPRHNAISYNYNLNADIPLTLIQNELRGQRGQSDSTRENGLEVIRSLGLSK